ncbi:MAG: ABC transporter permease, partial [Aestuariivirga sp.]
GPVRTWARVTVPLLKAPLLSAAAVGFAVSMVQFVPAQLLGAGRYSTLPMEAVTLSSGGNRALTAAFALLLTVPPLLAFLLAARLGRPRWG